MSSESSGAKKTTTTAQSPKKPVQVGSIIFGVSYIAFIGSIIYLYVRPPPVAERIVVERHFITDENGEIIEHLHDERYAGKEHEHDERYASKEHEHDERYAGKEHEHPEKSNVNHRHDGEYAPLFHIHQNYAPSKHVHTEYSLTSHQHTNYATLNHTHDEFYSPLNHTHPRKTIRFIEMIPDATERVRREKVSRPITFTLGAADDISRQNVSAKYTAPLDTLRISRTGVYLFSSHVAIINVDLPSDAIIQLYFGRNTSDGKFFPEARAFVAASSLRVITTGSVAEQSLPTVSQPVYCNEGDEIHFIVYYNSATDNADYPLNKNLLNHRFSVTELGPMFDE